MKKWTRIAVGILVLLVTWSVGGAIISIFAPAYEMFSGLIALVIGAILMTLIITNKPQKNDNTLKE